MNQFNLEFEAAPYRLSGVVYGALLNDHAVLDALGEAAVQPPYKGLPSAPVLAIKPRNTLVADGAEVTVPDGVEALEIGASLGIVIGRTACRVPASRALACVAGYTIVADLGVPLESHYRPGVRFKARDGFCPIGPHVVPASEIHDPDALNVRVRVDGAVVHHSTTGRRIRNVACLIQDVTEFMTLQPGDVLMLGVAAGAPLARASQSVAMEIEGLGRLSFGLVAEASA
jgi:5-oxopent-3-ene-1,2,5-tricarboxylate decarboxylase/2-hydroxyhepta-2,4-diene-1,7-dioate isomerase